MRLTLSTLALVLCLAPGFAEAADAPRIAVVDMTTLIQNHPSAKQLDERFQEAKTSAMGAWNDMQERLKDMLAKIEKMNRTDPDRRLREKAYEQQKVTAEFSRRWAEREAVNEYVRSLERIYADVIVHVNTYARNNNLQLVLQRETKPESIEAAGLDDFFVKLRLRSVLFSAPELDITAKVQAQMDGK